RTWPADSPRSGTSSQDRSSRRTRRRQDMQLGMVGLGRMGANMVRRLMAAGHECVVYDRSPENVAALVKEGATGSSSLDEFVAKLKAPRAAWVMVPAGDATETTVMAIAERMQ